MLLAALLAIAPAVLLLLFAAAHQEDGSQKRRQRVVIYYANETSLTASQSPNYKALLDTLRESRSEAGSTIAKWIESDSSLFRTAVRRDEEDLFRAAREFGFDLAFFDNAKALAGEYRFFDHRNGVDRPEPFGILPAAENPILATSPLTRAVGLRAALENVANLYGNSPLDVVLIAFSHGSSEMAVMPRVSANLSAPDARQEFIQLLRDGPNAGNQPAWAQIQGISKRQFWQVLDDIGSQRPVRFPLVFRQSCSSGISDFAELRQLPASVERLAHTGEKNLHLAKIDYRKIFSVVAPGTDWQAILEGRLASDPIKVQGRATLWIDPLKREIASLHPASYFLPLAAWVLWLMVIFFWPIRPRALPG